MNIAGNHSYWLGKVKMIIVIIFFFSLENVFSQVAQDDASEINPNGYNIFYHENGEKSSEGLMRNGNPDGYWKTYYKNGVLKSEGNRENFKLDSTWKFYDENGELALEINYEDGKKDGLRITYGEEEIIEEPFVNGVKQGTARYLYPDGALRKTIYYEDNLATGFSKEYGKDGRVITLIEYKKGYILSRERINRYDRQGRKNGRWKWFYEQSGSLKREGSYSHGLKDGYFKAYDEEGNLEKVEKYVNGELQEDAREVADLEVITDYYPDGSVKTVGSYKNGVPEGIRREYDKEGNITKAFVFKAGEIIGEGIIKENGQKDGSWIGYYQDGKIKVRGIYEDNVKMGKWTYYYPNGKVEQTGKYVNGKPDGGWVWYYPSGAILREENYFNGLKEGLMTEYSESGEIVIQGEYISGNREGFWTYNYGDHREEGNFANDLQSGEWTYFFPDGSLHFQGSYIDGNPNGKHIFYWINGNKKIEGNYIMGRKHKQWIKYDKEGNPYLIITYENGVEKSYDGIRIDPALNQ